ncbi:nuclear transport factor 2 family protein [Micromonospora sp. AMSO31t]|uniref:nuclear transport factor 2 family protein n=1 Tax=Micromonospora sp. AMSO31t TaxID=2650566 RepID=UPI00124B386D|nr:nuclear transport factor 2 family protein [Micromonospora sp. AMSO31t]KAB1916422.1 nuclear transport factor 2 family protein [Micromonospora sp. AMSO31t]
MELIETYLAAWNTADPAARRALVDEVWTADGTYTDPLAAVAGRDQIDALIGAVQQQFPGLEFRLAGPVDAHHDLARFTWHLGPPGAEPIVVGFDVAVIVDGRIATVHGFLDRVPA